MIGFQLKRTLKIGVKSLWLHKLRSMLTVLGITFGVCSVIAMLAIGAGASEEAQAQLKKLGRDNIIIQSVKPPENQRASQEQSRLLQYGLTYTDLDVISGTVPGVIRTVPTRQVRTSIFRRSHRMDTSIVGTTPEYLPVTKSTILEGRFLTPLDMQTKSNVCVLGRHAQEVLFPLEDAIGQVISRSKLRFRVVGVMTSLQRGKFGAQEMAADPNSEVYIPFSTMKRYFGANNIYNSSGTFSAERVELHEIIVATRSPEHVRPAERVIRHILKTLHDKEDYQIIVPLQLLIQARHTEFIFKVVLGSIAAISLLVGGIGIMNISLATVMERTREIGIRRAMGAKKRHIVFQFLIETLLLALFGGVMGIGLGVILPAIVQRTAGMQTSVTLWSLLMAFGISAAVGLIFGIYPAYRAANMDPIEALRHE
ncbi:MAG: ABC transporter permease [Planctomycetes bacterium]|nr:ABC transporter permease [Planctomycetota bacterium]